MSHATSSWTLTAAAASTPAATGRSTYTPGVDWKLGTDGDLEIVSDLTFTNSIEAVAQGIRNRIQMFEGEWFADLEFGIPYFTEILGEKFNEAKVKKEFREMILDCPGVTSIASLETSFDKSTRQLSVSFKVVGDSGTISADLLI